MVHIPLFKRTNNCDKIVKTISLNSRSIRDATAISVQICSVLWKSNYSGCSASDLTWTHEQNSMHNKEKWLLSWNWVPQLGWGVFCALFFMHDYAAEARNPHQGGPWWKKVDLYPLPPLRFHYWVKFEYNEYFFSIYKRYLLVLYNAMYSCTIKCTIKAQISSL